MRFSFVDLETTGLDPGASSIVELAILTTDDRGTVIDRYETMLNPLLKMQATRIHGIKATHVLAAPTFDLVAADVAERLDGTVLVAYNAPFDSRFLGQAMELVGGRIDGKWVCALEHARASKPGLPRHRLGDVAGSLGLQSSGAAHTALVDAELCAQAFFSLGACRQAAKPSRVTVGTRYRVPPMPRSAAEVHGTSRRPVANERSLTRTATDVSGIVSALHDALADGTFTLAEVKGLAAASQELGLTAGDLLAAFNQFLDEALAVVLADGKVDSDERHRLRVISHHLGFPAPYIERRLLGEADAGDLSAGLQPGLTVVFTNVDDDLEWALGQVATAQGLCIRHGVSKTTDLVVIDGPPSTTKANKALELGIPLMPLAEFEAALRGVTRPQAQPAWSEPTAPTRVFTGAELDGDDEVGRSVQPTERRAGSLLRRLLRRA
ncbi:MAG: hypothetical protein JJE52_12655 [Acidimicrobiia bacterium]|nr:hypothetical protein [Acidimicrobiia bacterium]